MATAAIPSNNSLEYILLQLPINAAVSATSSTSNSEFPFPNPKENITTYINRVSTEKIEKHFHTLLNKIGAMSKKLGFDQTKFTHSTSQLEKAVTDFFKYHANASACYERPKRRIITILKNLSEIEILLATPDIPLTIRTAELTQLQLSFEKCLEGIESMTYKCKNRLVYLTQGGKFAVIDARAKLLDKFVNDYLKKIRASYYETNNNVFIQYEVHLYNHLHDHVADKYAIPRNNDSFIPTIRPLSLTPGELKEFESFCSISFTPYLVLNTIVEIFYLDHISIILAAHNLQADKNIPFKELEEGVAHKLAMATTSYFQNFAPNFVFNEAQVFEYDDNFTYCKFNSILLKHKVSKAILKWIHSTQISITHQMSCSTDRGIIRSLLNKFWLFNRITPIPPLGCTTISFKARKIDASFKTYKINAYDLAFFEIAKKNVTETDQWMPLTLPLLNEILKDILNADINNEMKSAIICDAISHTTKFSELTLFVKFLPRFTVSWQNVIINHAHSIFSKYIHSVDEILVWFSSDEYTPSQKNIVRSMLDLPEVDAAIFEKNHKQENNTIFFKNSKDSFHNLWSILEKQKNIPNFYRALSTNFIRENCKLPEVKLWYRKAFANDWKGLFISTLTILPKNQIGIPVDYLSSKNTIFPLLLACVHIGKTQIFNVLIEHLNDTGNQLKTKLELHAEDGASRKTALHFACMPQKERMIKPLLELGLNANAQDCEMYTPLHIAIINKCSPDVIYTLYEKTNIGLKNIWKEDCSALIKQDVALKKYIDQRIADSFVLVDDVNLIEMLRP